MDQKDIGLTGKVHEQELKRTLKSFDFPLPSLTWKLYIPSFIPETTSPLKPLGKSPG